jgi:hypothetical protein
VATHRSFGMPFASVHPAYVRKAARKGRTLDELDEVIRWPTGYDAKALQDQIERKVDLRTFFAEAPRCIRIARR